MSAVETWVDAPPERAGQVLVQYAHALEARLESRLRNWEIYAAVYSEQLETSLRPSRTRYLSQPTAARNANLTFNVSRSIVETEHATITEADPRPTFLTEDGNQPEQDKAIELQRAIDGVMSDLQGYDTIARAELDKCVLGTGVHKVHAINGRPAIERVLISEILVDEDLVGAGKDPYQIIHRTEVPRAAMLVYCKKLGKEVLEAIKKAPALIVSGLNGDRADLIAVYDAYSLPIDEENPGRNAIAIEGYDPAIDIKDWKSPRLPFVFQRWQRPTTGFYGIGIVEQTLGKQVEINKFYRNISKGLTRWGGVTCLLPTLAKIEQATWTNAPEGRFVPYDPAGGGQPVFLNGPKLSPEDLEWLKFQIDSAYKDTGVPQNAAWAQREEGIPSAQGQREVSQKAASRLNPQSKQYERALVQTAWLLDDVIRKLVEDGEELVISTADQGALHRVDIASAISLKPGTYKIDVFPGNLFSRHPASKRQEIQEFANSGIFTADDVKALVDDPDVSARLGKKTDVRGIYGKQISKALKHGVYTPPEALWPQKELGVSMYVDALFEALGSGVPDDRLQLLRTWITKMKDIMAPLDKAPAAPATPPAPAAAPPAQPAPEGAPLQ
jgi:hypothetical protein